MNEDQHHPTAFNTQSIPTGCPIPNCPNRKTALGKGYSYLFALALTGLLVWQSASISYDKEKGWTLATRDLPMTLLIPVLGLIATALGLPTDTLASGVGKILTGGK